MSQEERSQKQLQGRSGRSRTFLGLEVCSQPLSFQVATVLNSDFSIGPTKTLLAPHPVMGMRGCVWKGTFLLAPRSRWPLDPPGAAALNSGSHRCTVHRGDRLHGLSQTQTTKQPAEGGHTESASSGETESLGVLVSLPCPMHSRVWSCRKGWGRLRRVAVRRLSCQARPLISRTNSDVLDLEHIYKPSENICEQASDSRPPERGSPAWALGLGLARSAPATTLPTPFQVLYLTFKIASGSQGCAGAGVFSAAAADGGRPWLQHVKLQGTWGQDSLQQCSGPGQALSPHSQDGHFTLLGGTWAMGTGRGHTLPAPPELGHKALR